MLALARLRCSAIPTSAAMSRAAASPGDAPIARDCLDDVAYRVSVVEDVPELGFLLIALDYRGFEAARARDNALASRSTSAKFGSLV